MMTLNHENVLTMSDEDLAALYGQCKKDEAYPNPVDSFGIAILNFIELVESTHPDWSSKY